jgi:hypothetical protein
LRRNRQTAPMGAGAYSQNRDVPMQEGSLSPTSPMSTRGRSGGQPFAGGDRPATARSLALTQASDVTNGGSPWPAKTQVKPAPPVRDDELTMKLLQREQNHGNAEDARFFGEVAEYIDLLQLDVARNKKYRTDAEERERVVTKGFMEREMRYAQEMRELENLLAKAKAERDELMHDTSYVQSEIDRVREEKSRTTQDRERLEEVGRATADRLRADIRDALVIKADQETQIYKVKRRQEEQEEENARLRTYLSKCKEDLDRALR